MSQRRWQRYKCTYSVCGTAKPSVSIFPSLLSSSQTSASVCQCRKGPRFNNERADDQLGEGESGFQWVETIGSHCSCSCGFPLFPLYLLTTWKASQWSTHYDEDLSWRAENDSINSSWEHLCWVLLEMKVNGKLQVGCRQRKVISETTKKVYIKLH